MSDSREKLIAFLIILVVPLLSFIAFRNSAIFRSAEGTYQDKLMVFRGPVPCSSVVVVAIDDESIEKLGHWPWRGKILSMGLDRIKGEKVLGIDILFSEYTDFEDDSAIVASIEKHKNVVLPVSSSEDGLIFPAMPFRIAATSVGHVVLHHSVDGTIRKAFAVIPFRQKGILLFIPAFAIELYRLYNSVPPDSTFLDQRKHIYRVGDLEIPLFKNGTFLINYTLPNDYIPTVSFYKLFTSSLDSTVFKNKIVIVGVTAVGMQQDQLITPLSQKSMPMSGVGVQANIVAMLLKDLVIKPVNGTLIIVVIALLMALAAWLFEYQNICFALGYLMGLIVIGLPLSFALFIKYHFLVSYPTLFVVSSITAFWGLIVRLYQLSHTVVRLTNRLRHAPIILPSVKISELSGIEKQIKELVGVEDVKLARSCPPGYSPFFVRHRLKLCIKPVPSPEARRFIRRSIVPLMRILMGETDIGNILIGGLDEAVKNLTLIGEKIRAQNKALNILLNTAEGGLIVTDTLGNIKYINDRAASALGTQPDFVRNANLLEFLEKNPHIKSTVDFRDVLLNMKSHVFGEMENTKTGKVYQVGVSFSQSEEGLGGLVIVLYDITKLKELLEARELALYGLTHQFATPVTVIREYARLLKRNPDKASEKILDAIINSANNLESLIHNFAYFAKLDRETASETFTEYDLREVIEAAIEEVKPKYPDKDLEVSMPDTIKSFGNPEMIGVVVNNLIDNGLKYSKSKVAVRVYEDSDGCIKIEVADDGPGIPEEEQKYVFDPFRRGKTRKKGFGLGLAIVRKIIELHNGEIYVENDPVLGGAKFTIRLPSVKCNK